MADWEKYVDVCCGGNSKHKCAIKLDEVYCDGYLKGKKIGAISHFHSDHISAIEDCLRKYDAIVIHPTTLRAIGALDSGWPHCEQWTALEYDTLDTKGSLYRTYSSEVRLLKANHIPGSSQVHVITNGISLLYSGDFSYPFAPIREADYLVLDATHGDPSVDGKTDRKSVLNRMFEDVKEKIDKGKSVMITTDSGTLQEIIKHFEMYEGDEPKLSHDIPFVARKNQIKILNEIYKEEKNEFREIMDFDDREFWKIHRRNKPCVVFLVDRIIPEELENYYRIITGRYQFRQEDPPIIHHKTNTSHYNLASHASLEGVLKYVEDVNPKVVITDASRSEQAKSLAKIIELKFDKVRAYPRGGSCLE